ncbi:MAG TPA: oligosaccharide flippase family protein [Bacteroidales bacterium]
MKRKFIKNLFLLIILNLLIKPFWIFGIDRSVQNTVGSGEYGFYFSLLGFTFLFNILLDFGITNFNNRSISQDQTLFKGYFSNIVVVKFLLAVIYGIISFSVALMMGYEKRQLELLIVLIFNQFLSSFILYLRSNISGMQFYTTDSLLSVLDRFIMIILCSIAIWGHILGKPFRIEWFVYLQTFSYMLAVIVIGSVIFIKSGHFVFSFNPTFTFQIIKQTIPFAILGLLMSIYNRTDSVLLERLLPDGQAQAGIYAQSYRILDAFSNFSLLFASLLLPMFANLIGSKEDIRPLLKTSFSLLFVACIAVSLSCMTFSKPIIGTLYHEGHDDSVKVFAILVLSFIPVSINYIFGTLLTANGNLKLLNYAALGAVCLNIMLNLVLIPLHKAIGAAIANLVTQTLMTLAQIIICFKIWKFNIRKLEFIRYSLFTLIAIAIIFLFSLFKDGWLIRFSATFVSICFLGLLTGILPITRLLEIVRLQLKGVNP